MKTSLFAGLAAGVIALAMSAMSNAAITQSNTGLASPLVTIAFDELSLTQGTVVTNQYSGLGVTFSPNMYQWTAGGIFPNVDAHQLTNFSAIPNGSALVNPLTFDFTADQTAVAFAFLSNPTTTTFATYLSGAFIESAAFATTFDSPNNWFQFSGNTFDRIVVTASDNGLFSQNMGIDNMQIGIAPIPEPEIYAMLGLGLGLIGWARRRKARAA